MIRVLVIIALAGLLTLGLPVGFATVAAQQPDGAVAQQLEPALEISEEAEAPEQPAWTYRYLVPTSIVLAVVTGLGVILGYFVRVTRARYRVVK